MRRTFTLESWQDEGWYVGQLREVPGVFSQGETLTELEENIRDAFELVLEDSGKPVLRNIQQKEIEVARNTTSGSIPPRERNLLSLDIPRSKTPCAS